MKGKLKSFFCLLFLLVCCQTANCINRVNPSTQERDSSILLLFERLDVENYPALLQKSKKDKGDISVGNDLLHYFRSRENIHHPIKRETKLSYKGKIASANDLEVANDALRHIFVGQPAYPRFFCGDDIDWGFRPVPDNEWVWQLNRMTFWEAMAKAYWHTGDENYAKVWAEQLKDWIRKNPNDKAHSYAWRSIETGIRGYAWVNLYQRFIDSPHFTPEVLVVFLNSLYDHANFLMSKYTRSSNWALMEAEGLAFIAIMFPEFKDAEKWKKEAIDRLNAEIDGQVYNDGHQRELAIGYHTGCIEWFLRTYELAVMNGLGDSFPDSYTQKIEKMCEVPLKIALPNGTNVQFGDAWEGSPNQYSARFIRWGNIFGRDDFLYIATKGEEGKKPDSTAYALPISGIYSMRSDWTDDAICMVLKCGPNGGGHSHPDNGTFDLYAGGRNLMPDAGSYIYSGNPEGRAWFRQTNVHQTLTLDRKDTKFDPRLLLWKPGKDLDVLVVENKSYENLTHRRSLFFVDKRYFIIVDDAYGDAAGDVAIHFQLAPGDHSIDRVNNTVSTDFKDGWNLLVKNLPQEGIKLVEEEGWVSFKYTVKEPRPAFSYKLKKEQDRENIRFVTLLLPFDKNPSDIRINSITDFQENLSEMKLEIEENGETKRIEFVIN